MTFKSTENITLTLTIYFDGDCPLCLAEIHLLNNHNHKSLLNFVSLQNLGAADDGIDCVQAMQSIHARLGDMQIITGPDVFFEAYKRTDLKFINFIFSFFIIRSIYALFYLKFAKYRHQISKVIGPCLLTMVRKKYPSNKQKV
jgi:predicted DCC family thiol-disulfide oxidoreductase YuxK